MLVGNHDGGYLAPDGICLGVAWHERFEFKRPLFFLMHDLPFRIARPLTEWLHRLGIRAASHHTLEKVFAQGDSLLVYPGGAYEAFRGFWQRRSISLGHRTGFVAQALKQRVPITPVASVGGHETLLVLARGHALAKRFALVKKLRSDVLPLWLGLPWGIGFGPMPHIPLPAKISVRLLEPIRLWRELGETANPDDPHVRRAGFEIVRRRIESAVGELYDQRRWPIIG